MNIILPFSQTEYPIRKIFCIGRNYAKHAKELGNSVPEHPVVFMKSSNALSDSDIIQLPTHGSDCQHEAELVVLIGKTGKHISVENAPSYIAGFGLGLDLTLRDVQTNLKSKGLPWELAKAFDGSAPLGPFVTSVPNLHNLSVICKVNGEIRQNGFTGDMIFSIPYLIHFLSGIFTLTSGDIIFTGTPDGVGPLIKGDQVEVIISDIGTKTWTVA